MEVCIFQLFDFYQKRILNKNKISLSVFKHYLKLNSNMRITEDMKYRNLIMIYDSSQVRIFEFQPRSITISMNSSDTIEDRQSTFYRVVDDKQHITTAHLLVRCSTIFNNEIQGEMIRRPVNLREDIDCENVEFLKSQQVYLLLGISYPYKLIVHHIPEFSNISGENQSIFNPGNRYELF